MIGYGFFIEEDELLQLRADSVGKSVNDMLLHYIRPFGKEELLKDPIKYWKGEDKSYITYEKILESKLYISIYRTFSYYYDGRNNTPNSIMFVGELFMLEKSIRYSQFFQFIENKDNINIDKVNNEIKENGFNPSLCDFYIINSLKGGIIYKKDEVVKL